MVKRYLESPTGTLILALIIWSISLFSSYYILYNYCPPLKLFGPNRWAFIAVILSSAIGALVYHKLAKRSQLDEIRLEYRSGLILGSTAIIGTLFVFEDFDMAVKVASAFATLFFAGFIMAGIMLLGNFKRYPTIVSTLSTTSREIRQSASGATFTAKSSASKFISRPLATSSSSTWSKIGDRGRRKAHNGNRPAH